MEFIGGLLGTIPIGRKYGPITRPIHLRIEDGRLTELSTDDERLLADLRFCFEFDHYTGQVNEIGFGTNTSITGPLRGFNYKHEESRLGFHLGFGASLAQQNVETLNEAKVTRIVTTANGTMFLHSGANPSFDPVQPPPPSSQYSLGLFRSDDGLNWSAFNTGIPGNNDGLAEGALAVDGNRVFTATTDGKIWYLDTDDTLFRDGFGG